MKLSLKSVNGKLRLLAQRVGRGLKFVLDCCCETTESFVIGYNCCEGWGSVPRIAIRLDIARQLESECRWDWALMVRVRGNESCYRLTPFQIVSQDEIAGLAVIDNRNQIECVPNSRTYPGVQCGTQSCPPCPTNCCFVHVYPKDCPDFHGRLNQNPKGNICCSWGRDYTITVQYNTRLVEEYYDVFGVLYTKNIVRFNGRDVVRNRVCDPQGNQGGTPTCLEGNHYKSQEFMTAREGTTFEEFRLDRCITLGYPDRFSTPVPGPTVPPAWPSVMIFPCRPSRTLLRNPDGSAFVDIKLDDDCSAIDRVCEDLENFVSTMKYTADRDQGIDETYTTTFRYGLGCLQGSVYFDQISETVSRPDNKLLARRFFRHEASFSVVVNSSTFCPPSICDGYAQTGNMVTLPGLPVPQPIQGALNLL